MPHHNDGMPVPVQIQSTLSAPQRPELTVAACKLHHRPQHILSGCHDLHSTGVACQRLDYGRKMRRNLLFGLIQRISCTCPLVSRKNPKQHLPSLKQAAIEAAAPLSPIRKEFPTQRRIGDAHPSQKGCPCFEFPMVAALRGKKTSR